ncbi:TetR family transcriptional regulator [Devosia pacifica]|uniref:TetR family transcriptional regulator n=1 Tax=Devosia pacifica TaxID=1335967 RepID=A0A918S454_9HYPH|nr:TetR family transcriptional regulator [Devosia pacifica]
MRDNGPELSLRRVARLAGVSAAAPYRHFRTIDDLYGAVAAEGFLMLATRLTAEGDDLAALGRAYVRFALRNAALFRVMFGTRTARSCDPALRKAAGSAYDRLAEAARRTCGAGAIDADAPLSAWAQVHGLAMLLLDGQLDTSEDDIDALVRRITERFVAGLRATA